MPKTLEDKREVDETLVKPDDEEARVLLVRSASLIAPGHARHQRGRICRLLHQGTDAQGDVDDLRVSIHRTLSSWPENATDETEKVLLSREERQREKWNERRLTALLLVVSEEIHHGHRGADSQRHLFQAQTGRDQALCGIWQGEWLH